MLSGKNHIPVIFRKFSTYGLVGLDAFWSSLLEIVADRVYVVFDAKLENIMRIFVLAFMMTEPDTSPSVVALVKARGTEYVVAYVYVPGCTAFKTIVRPEGTLISEPLKFIFRLLAEIFSNVILLSKFPEHPNKNMADNKNEKTNIMFFFIFNLFDINYLNKFLL